MRNIIFGLVLCLAGCVGFGNYEVNTVLPDWQYMRSDEPGYLDRDRRNSGNCVAYSGAAYNELMNSGIDEYRLKLWSCKVNGKGHMVCILDGCKVYSVGEKWVLYKDGLDWEWIGEGM